MTAVASWFFIFAYGLFSIAAQTLIFREFTTSFESNDIAVGIFFGCWFLWVALGAIVVNKSGRLAGRLTANIEWVLLAYLPAFVIQAFLIIEIRRLAGIAPYTLLPIPAVLILGVSVNAPVSFLTGLLFPLICKCVRRDTTSAVSRVYLFESLGSFVGGLGTTALLAYGVSPAQVFLIISLILSVAVLSSLFLVSQLKRIIFKTITALVVVFLSFTIISGSGTAITKFVNTVRWSRLLPAESFVGSFQTAQAQYLYGKYQNQWVVERQGSVIETVPDPTSAGRVIALTISQNPKARRVLIVGSGLSLCRQFLQLPQIDRLVWAQADGEYIDKVLEILPADLTITDKRFEGRMGDVRSILAQGDERFDLVIINMPETLNAVSNRYWTLDFYGQVKRSLNPDGVLAICVASGENIMGTELVTIGASAKATLSRVFKNMVFVPGDWAWFIASDGDNLTGEPGDLRDRFAGIAGAEAIYPANGLLSIYIPDRAEKSLDAYNSADLPAEHLINLDSRPLANLFSLLLSVRQSDAPVTRLFRYLLPAGLPVFLAPIVIFVLIRFMFIFTSRAGDRVSVFDCAFLVFSAGAVGIGVVVVLMFLYQTRFGSLYLYIGAVSSLYMAGLAAGAYIAGRLLAIRSRLVFINELILAGVLAVHCAAMVIIALWPTGGWRHLHFAVSFIVCGLCAGCYFPIAARLLADRQIETTTATSGIEKADHFGAMAGGLLASLVLIPVLGARAALFIFILLVLVNVPFVILRILRPAVGVERSPIRAAGWTLVGVAASLVIFSNIIASAKLRLSPTLPVQAAQSLVGSLRIRPAETTVPDTNKQAIYYKVYDAGGTLTGFIFSSDDFARDVRGFGGPINIAVLVDVNGGLIDFRIIHSNETPDYLDMLSEWFGSLKGRDVFGPEPFAGIDAVTGATISSTAIMKSLAQSGAMFATGVLGQSAQQGAGATGRWTNPEGVYLVGALLLTVIVIYRGGFKSRLCVLIFNIIVGGLVFNAQYSTEQIVTLLSGTLPAASLAGVYLLVVGVPLAAIFFGNIYCGYMCPFGALQELIGLLLPKRLRPLLSQEQMRKTRLVKYVVLFALIVLYFASRNHNAIAYDPLIKAFSFSRLDVAMLVIIGIIIAGSIFYSRFWCRYLCPAGAFLSLFNKIAIFSRFLPAKRYANCEYGVSFNDKLDCIYCDKCRFESRFAGVTEKSAGFKSHYFLTAVIIIAVGIAAVSVKSVVNQLSITPVAVSSASSQEQHRNVDTQQIKKMIQENKLSDHEANFYKKLD